MRVATNTLDVYKQLGGVEAIPVGTVSPGEAFEVTQQKSGWGKIGEERWINQSYTMEI
jgi:predicted ATP-dependent Lon-type protease